MDTFRNLLGQNNLNTNTIVILLLVLVIIFGYGNTSVCGFNFGCFNPSSLSPSGVSPESTDKCCYNPCYYPQGGGNSFLWIILIALFLLCFCKKDKKDCCCN